jgi:prepilin peptidase CpaA
VLVVLVTAIVVALASAISDLRTGRIPNWITGSAVLAGLVEHVALAWRGVGIEGIPAALGQCLAGAAICAAVPVLLYRTRALGGGDLKLFIALGVLLGPFLGLQAQLIGFVAGALLAPVHLAYRGQLGATLLRSIELARNAFRPPSRKKPIDMSLMTTYRLGPAILVGTLWAIVTSGGAP